MITSSEILEAALLNNALGDKGHGYLFNDSVSIEGPSYHPRTVKSVKEKVGLGKIPLVTISIDSNTGEVVAKSLK
jgi:hypothetical protein